MINISRKLRTKAFNDSLNKKKKEDTSKFDLNTLAKRIIFERKKINPLILMNMQL